MEERWAAAVRCGACSVVSTLKKGPPDFDISPGPSEEFRSDSITFPNQHRPHLRTCWQKSGAFALRDNGIDTGRTWCCYDDDKTNQRRSLSVV